jgi:hypothetical protein
MFLMTEEFREEIREIAEKVRGSFDKAPEVVPYTDTVDEPYLDAVGEFFDTASRAVEIFNDVIRKRTLSLHRLNPEFFELFLGIPGRRDGFTIVSPHKIVILFDDEPSTLTVIGKKRTKDSAGAVLSPSKQLIKVTFNKNKEGTIYYSDNAGGRVDPYGLTALFIRWISSD